MAKTTTLNDPTNITAADLARLLDLQKQCEKTATRLVSTKQAQKAAKADHKDATEQLSKYLYSLNHGLPLFDGEPAEEA